MARYALVNNSTKQIEKEFDRNFTSVELVRMSERFGPSERTRIIPSIRLPDPVMDPVTEVLTGYGEPVVEADRVTRVRGTRLKTAEQLEQEDFQSKVQNAVDNLTNGTGTSLERLERVERLLARIITERYL